MIPEKQLTPESAAQALTRLAERSKAGKLLQIPPSLDSRTSATKLGSLLMELVHPPN
jgi:hypothetical protein